MWVDEARLSANKFHSARDEYEAVILNYDSQVIDTENQYNSGDNVLVSGDMYLF